jgi:hypothetical protein
LLALVVAATTTTNATVLTKEWLQVLAIWALHTNIDQAHLCAAHIHC